VRKLVEIARFYVASDPLLTTNRIRINTLALAARLPSLHGFRESSKREV
jgi:hypothetical protein